MRPDLSLDASRQRSALRRLVNGRGPDVGREVDHLKLTTGAPAEALLDAYERGETAYPATATLTTATGGLKFMLGVSKLGGSDTL